jgi:hypothetical protein
MAEQLPQTLETLGRRCGSLLVSALARSQGELHSGLEDIISRFKIWAGSIGLLANGRAGVDYRLESDTEARDVLYTMLKSLEKTLQRLIQPPTAIPSKRRRPEYERGDEISEPEAQSDSGSEESDFEDDIAFGSDAEENGVGVPSIRAAEEVLNHLYRFLKLVKSSSSSQEYSRVMDFASRRRDKAEEEESSFDEWIRFKIKREMPLASPTLVKRLIESGVYRRWKMHYKQEHAKKLSENIEDLMSSRAKTEQSGVRILEIEDITLVSPKVPEVITGTSLEAKDRFRFAPMSQTDASTTRRLALPLPRKSRAPTNMAPSEVIQRGKLDVPAAPKPERNASPEVVCPYCTQIISADVYGSSQAAKIKWALVFLAYRVTSH